jgi:hypothetical protein
LGGHSEAVKIHGGSMISDIMISGTVPSRAGVARLFGSSELGFSALGQAQQ